MSFERPVLSELERVGYLHPYPDTWIAYFGWPKNPLPMNGSHGHWASAAKGGKAVRRVAGLRYRSCNIPALGRCRAQVTWWVATRHVRDPDNLGLLEKRLFDALVDAGVVEDDRPALMDKPRGLILHVDESDGLVTAPGFTVTITRLATPGDAP